MGSFSWVHWLVVIILILLLFGRGRISDMMGDIGKGLKSFKQGMAEDEDKTTRPAEPKHLPHGERPIDVTPKQPAEPSPPPSAPPADDRS